MGNDNTIFLEIIEWFDESGQEMVHRIPEKGSGEIKYGAQLTVRESQAGILFYKGKACDAFGAGRHTLHTGNIPIVTKLLSVPWAGTSPLRAEVYLANLKIFTDLKWGTRNPVAFRDQELGLIRLRAHGVFNVQIVQPVLFINTMVGTMGKFSTETISEYLKRVIVSRFNDYLGEQLESIFDLPGNFDALSVGLLARLAKDFSQFGLGLRNLYITSITPPIEVQQAIDDQGRLEVIKDMDGFVRMKAAMAMEKAAETGGEAGAGMGMGMGMMLPAMFGNLPGQAQPATAASPTPHAEQSAASTSTSSANTAVCFECHHPISADSRFCPYCGHQQVILSQCSNCGKNLSANARFCSRCGHPADEQRLLLTCPHCRSENLPGSTFCNQCGKKMA